MTLRDVIARSRRGDEFVFDAGEPFFAGHFPGHPILPGVFQLEMARQAVERTLGPVTIHTVLKAKFQRPIKPGETVRLQLKLDGWQAHAKFFVGEQPAGNVLLLLEKA